MMNVIDKFKILTYNIGFVTCDLDTVMKDGIQSNKIVWLKHDYRDRFFADPFLIDSDSNYYYVVCEEYIFWEEKGKIALLTIEKKDYSLASKRVIIEEETHLSFPYCKYKGNTIVPESSASGKCIKYIIDINTKEVKSKQKLLNEGTIDAVFVAVNNINYMLTGKVKIPSSELYIYKEDKNGHLVQCSTAPIITDNRHARSAGDCFRWRGKMYRPVQDCRGRYGRQTKIMEIIEIMDDKLTCKEQVTLNSFENPPFNETLHTFNVYDDCILVDGSKDFFRFPAKIIYKLKLKLGYRGA